MTDTQKTMHGPFEVVEQFVDGLSIGTAATTLYELIRVNDPFQTDTQPTANDIKQTCKAAASEPGKAVIMDNKWGVVARRIYPQPARRGPAWTMHYWLISPTGKSFGGMTSVHGFASHFANGYAWQWRDDYTGNGYGKLTGRPEVLTRGEK